MNGLEVWDDQERPYLFVLDAAGSEICSVCLSSLLNKAEPMPRPEPATPRYASATPRYIPDVRRGMSHTRNDGWGAGHQIDAEIIILVAIGLFIVLFFILVMLMGLPLMPD